MQLRKRKEVDEGVIKSEGHRKNEVKKEGK